MRKRTKARECALQVLYQVNITGDDARNALRDFWETKGKFESAVKDFAQTLVIGTLEKSKKIDSIISNYATNWQLNTMARCYRCNKWKNSHRF